MTIISSASQLSDRDLLAHVQRAARDERHATVQLLILLIELEERRLFLGEGYPSLFAYCTGALHLSDGATFRRIETARAARRFPIILERLAEGSITLSAATTLSRHLTAANHIAVLDAARHQRKGEIERLAASLRPQPDVPSTVRKLPERRPACEPLLADQAIPPAIVQQEQAALSEAAERMHDAPPIALPSAIAAAAPPRRSDVKPLAPARYKIQFTVSRETYDRLRRAQDLLRHTIPNGDPAAIFERALTLLVADLEKTKLGAAKRPRAASASASRSRHIPASVRRVVWRRDEGQCAFRGAQGRCSETGFLEYHHVVPFAAGGATTVENIELRCRAHNAYEAEQDFGLQPLLRERDS